MPVTYEVASGLLTLRVEGDHTLAEEREALARALVSPALEIRAILLVDARRSTANPQAASIAERARCLAQLGECLLPRCAILVADSLHYGLARMLAVHAENAGLTVGVFTEELEAKSWLVSSDDQLDPRATDTGSRWGAIRDGSATGHSTAADGTGTRRGPSGRLTPSLPSRR